MRRLLSPIALRLLLFNLLLVFLPVAGLLSLRSLEQQLLDQQERAMVQQGRVLAAALGGNAQTIDAGSARALLQRLGGRSEARIRIADRQGRVIADSASGALFTTASAAESGEYRVREVLARKRILYRVGVKLWQAWSAFRGLFENESNVSSGSDDPTPREVIGRALQGRYGATLRVSAGQRSLTLYSALPVRAEGNGDVIGAVLVSQSTSRILRALWRVRLDTFEVFAWSVVAAMILSLLMSATIARPLIRLRNEADDLLDHRGRLRRAFGGSRRRDEIGDLTRALAQLTARLEKHLLFVESFSADVSHEFKNPLASIRNAAELLAHSRDPQEREALSATIEKEVTRLSRLLSVLRELSTVDAAVDMELTDTIELRALLVEVAGDRAQLTAPPHPVMVRASEDRLAQAFGNIVDNAVSFSPNVRISLFERDGSAVVRVDDEGPGIPAEHLDRIFDRFFTFRDSDRSQHYGLGLAIARAVVDAYGGRIHAENLTPHGARIEVQLPLTTYGVSLMRASTCA